MFERRVKKGYKYVYTYDLEDKSINEIIEYFENIKTEIGGEATADVDSDGKMAFAYDNGIETDEEYYKRLEYEKNSYVNYLSRNKKAVKDYLSRIEEINKVLDARGE